MKFIPSLPIVLLAVLSACHSNHSTTQKSSNSSFLSMTSNFSAIKQEQYQMNSRVQNTDNKTLWEMFGNPEDWELHVYSIPLEIEFFKPLTADDLKNKKITNNYHHHYSSGSEIISAIDAIKGFPFTHESRPPVDIRVLLAFKHKYKNETINLVNDGYTSVFHVERNTDGQTEKLPAIIISDENKYRILKQLFLK